MRKLASVQVVDRIDPIEGADRIEAARVMGWTVVAKRGEFAVGDRCVFFEIDSLLPETAEWAEFMRPRGFRVKTVRLRGVLSQGLALPLSILGPGAGFSVGDDVTERLGVRKWEPPVPEVEGIAGPFPSGVPKTDEIRLQSALGVLDEIRGLDFYVTTKLDGQSATLFRGIDGRFGACHRNFEIKRGNGALWQVATRLEALVPAGFAIQGELCGPGIQKNRLDLEAPEFFAFNIFDIRRGVYLGFEDFVRCCAEVGIKTVPVEMVVHGDEAARYEHTLDGWLGAAKGLYVGTKNRKEGVVVRPLVERSSRALGGARLSFKVINNDFLLKDEN